MVSQISNAISRHWKEWADHWGVNRVRYIVGMNYSTAKNSNKKDWHIVRLAEEQLAADGFEVTSSCTTPDPRRPLASAFFSGQDGDQSLRVETLQGRELWSHIADAQDAYLKICWAIAKCLNATPVAEGSSFTTGQMHEILRFSQRLDVPGVSDGEKQWLVFLARHFVDRLDINS